MIDGPRQIVRALDPGEFTPFYSTAELLLGVRHVVHRHSTAYDENELRLLEARRSVAAKRLESRVAEIKNLMEQALTNNEIAAILGIGPRQVSKYITKVPELQAASRKRLEERKENKNSKGKNIRLKVGE